MQNLVGAAIVFVIIVFCYGIYTHSGKTTNTVSTPQIISISNGLEIEGTKEELVKEKGVIFTRINRTISSDARIWDIILGASSFFQIPPEILLSTWYLESGMELGGDRGGAGGHFALAQLIKKQDEPEEAFRWHRFAMNEKSLKKICRHCGYSCDAIRGSSTGALGPMQFQPDTWISGAVDADGDGRVCPLDLPDAVYTAAMKLRNHAEYFSERYRNLNKGDKTVITLVKKGVITNKWDYGVLKYVGAFTPQTFQYLRRHQSLRKIFDYYVKKYNEGHDLTS